MNSTLAIKILIVAFIVYRLIFENIKKERLLTNLGLNSY